MTLVDLPPGLGVEEAESRFEALGDVSFAQPNRIYHEAVTNPDDEFYRRRPRTPCGASTTPGSRSPTLEPDPARRSSTRRSLPEPPVASTADADIDAPEAWDTETGDAAVTVGVIDSGITLAHEDLSPNLWTNPGEIPGDMIDNDSNLLVDDVNGWDFVEGDNTPDDASGHGIHVAGALGAQGDNTFGTTGASWDVSLVGLKAGSADGRLYTRAIIDAIQYADDKDIPIVNGSYIGSGQRRPA